MVHDLVPDGSYDQLISLKEVNHFAQVLENQMIRLHLDDAILTKLLMKQLSSTGALIF